ncbi:hypothetical protein I3760_10G118000 [Carya illinoinensis]|nr:hypothetical protein I3760_10G118000 [Carya illinoinensis]
MRSISWPLEKSSRRLGRESESESDPESVFRDCCCGGGGRGWGFRGFSVLVFLLEVEVVLTSCCRSSFLNFFTSLRFLVLGVFAIGERDGVLEISLSGPNRNREVRFRLAIERRFKMGHEEGEEVVMVVGFMGVVRKSENGERDNIQDFSLVQRVSKRKRNSDVHIDIVEEDSSRQVCVIPDVEVCQSHHGSVGFRQLLKVVPFEAYSLPLVPSCIHCKAKRFHHETTGFCCADGTISLATNDVPDQLYALFTSNTDESTHFRTYIRTYNNKFAFTSFGVKFDKDLCRRNRGIYTFRTQGQIYHYINDLVPSNRRPSYLQLYFYDTEHELENRISDSNRMDPSIVTQLIDILRINPYSIFFRSLGDLPDLENQIIHIRSDTGHDQRVFNAPTSSQVAAIWVENDDEDQLRGRDIFVFNHYGGSHIVQYYFGCYDPLQYPLLFPFGDVGWHQGIERISRGRRSTYNETNGSINPQQSVTAEELLAREQRGQIAVLIFKSFI